jgi:TolB protein
VNQVCLVRADGSGFQQLTSGDSNSYYPTLSPDGRHIIYAMNEYDQFDLYRLAPSVHEGARGAESRIKRLTHYIGNAFSPSYSPDGRLLAFVNRVEGESSSLWIMGSDGHDPHPIFAGTGDIVGTDWSPEGLELAFMMNTDRPFAYEVFAVDARAGAQTPRQISKGLSDIGGSVSWSPDGTNLLVFAGPAAAREVYRLDALTGESTRLTYGGNNASPAYSPDGQWIVFNSLRNGGQADLFIMRSDGHSMRQLTEDPEPDWQPDWGP